jgi:hypothetical protein
VPAGAVDFGLLVEEDPDDDAEPEDDEDDDESAEVELDDDPDEAVPVLPESEELAAAPSEDAEPERESVR